MTEVAQSDKGDVFNVQEDAQINATKSIYFSLPLYFQHCILLTFASCVNSPQSYPPPSTIYLKACLPSRTPSHPTTLNICLIVPPPSMLPLQKASSRDKNAFRNSFDLRTEDSFEKSKRGPTRKSSTGNYIGGSRPISINKSLQSRTNQRKTTPKACARGIHPTESFTTMNTRLKMLNTTQDILIRFQPRLRKTN